MSIHEITLLETKPATEWVRGRALQKVSPQDAHARAQLQLGAAMLSWAKERGLGRVGTEWEFRVALGYEQRQKVLIPHTAPTVAVEVISPDDRRDDIEDKISTYLAAGTLLVLLVDPQDGTFMAHDPEGAKRFTADETFRHPSMPGFSIGVGSAFEEIRPKQPPTD